MDVDGPDDLADQLDEMAEKAEEFDGENQASYGELFDSTFMKNYTEFQSIDEFFEQSPWDVEDQNDSEAVSDDEFDAYVRDHTEFSSSEEMHGTAWKERISGQAGFE